MVWSADQRHLVFTQGNDGERVIARCPFDQRQIELIVQDGAFHRIGAQHLGVQLHCRVLLAEVMQKREEHGGCDGDAGADPQLSFVCPLMKADIHLLLKGQDALSIGIEALSGFGQIEPLGQPFKKDTVIFGFQLPYGKRYGRLS